MSKLKKLVPDASGRVSIVLQALRSFNYGFYAANHFSPNSDTLAYSVSAIPDVSPMIGVVESKDSAYADRLFFHGRIRTTMVSPSWSSR